MEGKICIKCLIDKNINDFYHKRNVCKECLIIHSQKPEQKIKKKEYDIKRRHKNIEKNKIWHKNYYENNKPMYIERNKKNNKRRYHTEPNFKINNRLTSSINQSLKSLGSSKNGHSKSEYLIYTIDEFRQHIESQFSHSDNLTPDGKIWMIWKNWGKYNASTWDDNDPNTWVWNLDHIIPKSDLPFDSMADDNFQKCWSLSNLRPLSAKQNILDGTQRKRHKNVRK